MSTTSGISAPERALTPGAVNALADAGTALARLDERLAASPPSVAAGWLSRALLHEAAASARLDGDLVDYDDLRLLDAGALDRLPDPALGRAAQVLRLLRSAARRTPRQVFTPRRLAAMADLTLRARAADRGDARPLPLVRLADPTEALAGLGVVLSPGNVEAWKGMPALLAAADVIARWHAHGVADLAGGPAGRALAAMWVARAGLTRSLQLMPSVGFLGHARGFRPDLRGEWPGHFLEACRRAAEWGLGLHAELAGTRARLLARHPARRSSSRMPALVELVVETPVVAAPAVAARLGTSAYGARLLLDELNGARSIVEISGRGSHRVFAC